MTSKVHEEVHAEIQSGVLCAEHVQRSNFILTAQFKKNNFLISFLHQYLNYILYVCLNSITKTLTLYLIITYVCHIY